MENFLIIKTGTFLYSGQTTCDIRIIFSHIRYGTGDHEDPEEICNDIERDAYYIQYGSTTERGIYNAGSSAFDSLEEALSAAHAIPGIGATILWN